MLKISESEMKVFSEIQDGKFREELIKYIKTEFPDETRELTLKNINEIAFHAQTKSNLYGFTEKSDICQYVNLMMIFGAFFDVKEKWAVKILNRDCEQSGAAKMLALYDEAETAITI